MTNARWIAPAILAIALWAGSAHASESYTYDPMGRLTDVAYANGGSLHYTYDGNGNILSLVASLAASGDDDNAPLQFTLGHVTPNPGSGLRDLLFSIPAAGHVMLRVFDVNGRQVATLFDRDVPAGRYGARFATDRWAAGVYYYKLAFGSRTRTGRMVVLR